MRVLLSSPYFSEMTRISFLITPRRSLRSARIAFSSSIFFFKLGVLVLDLLSLQTCQSTKTHVNDCLGLGVRQSEPLYQLGFCDLDSLGSADDPDHFIDIVKRDEQTLQDMGSLLRFVEIVFRPSCDNILLDASGNTEAYQECS